jgi:hypothetical protein
MKPFNEGKDYNGQVKPFGFLVAFMARGACDEEFEPILGDKPQRGRPSQRRTLKPIAPFERDPAKAVAQAFDRETGAQIAASELQTYAEALRFYHVSPEDKFENGGPVDVGRTERRRLVVTGIRLIGKEANKVGDAGESDPVSSAVAEFRRTADAGRPCKPRRTGVKR